MCMTFSISSSSIYSICFYLKAPFSRGTSMPVQFRLAVCQLSNCRLRWTYAGPKGKQCPFTSGKRWSSHLQTHKKNRKQLCLQSYLAWAFHIGPSDKTSRQSREERPCSWVLSWTLRLPLQQQSSEQVGKLNYCSPPHLEIPYTDMSYV